MPIWYEESKFGVKKYRNDLSIYLTANETSHGWGGWTLNHDDFWRVPLLEDLTALTATTALNLMH